MTSGLFEEKDMTSQPAVVSWRNFLCFAAAAAAFSPGFLRADDDIYEEGFVKPRYKG